MLKNTRYLTVFEKIKVISNILLTIKKSMDTFYSCSVLHYKRQELMIKKCCQLFVAPQSNWVTGSLRARYSLPQADRDPRCFRSPTHFYFRTSDVKTTVVKIGRNGFEPLPAQHKATCHIQYTIAHPLSNRIRDRDPVFETLYMLDSSVNECFLFWWNSSCCLWWLKSKCV